MTYSSCSLRVNNSNFIWKEFAPHFSSKLIICYAPYFLESASFIPHIFTIKLNSIIKRQTLIFFFLTLIAYCILNRRSARASSSTGSQPYRHQIQLKSITEDLAVLRGKKEVTQDDIDAIAELSNWIDYDFKEL